MLSAEGLGYVLPDSRVLFESVSFELHPGNALVIEGPSGTGKSTLLALLGGLLQPTSGQVQVDAGRRAPFAWVLQSLNCLGARSVLANACLHNLLDGEPPRDAQRRGLHALEALGIADLARRRARQLSGGEQQRLAVARAVASIRPIVLADEPTSQLDRHNAALVMQSLIAAAESGRCVVIVTHDRDALPEGSQVAALTESGLRDVSTAR